MKTTDSYSKREKADAIACIDDVSKGVITGWAYHKKKKDTPLEIAVVVKGKRIAEGSANKYRKDLEEAGIGKGNHAFSIALNPINESINEEDIELYDLKTKALIPLLDTSIKKLAFVRHTVVKEVLTVKNHLVEFSFRFFLPPKDDRELSFYVEDELVWSAPFSGQQQLKGSFLLPTKFMDGNIHLLKAVLHGHLVGVEAFIAPFHFTPAEYLKKDEFTPLFGSLTGQAKYRYESLIENLNRIDFGNKKEVAQLSNAHEKLVLGFEKNKDFSPLVFPKVKKPKVSIIIPVYNKFNITYHCLCSLLLAPNNTTYEVIIADDCSTDETKEIESIVSNIKVVKNKENLRFLKSCNQASKVAEGEFLVFLNNDTEVTKYWLDELIQVFEENQDAGLVGSKLLNADGTLQEAGGVIWKTGVPWNVGYGQNPFQPTFNYLREADYVSGASMMIRKELWETLGKFSLEYAPAYFEDTDLAFKVKNHGKKVYYTPFSQVFHFEGMSNGKDINTGIKKYQKVNQKTFKKKWAKLFKTNGEEGKDLHIEIDRGREKRVLVIDYQTPQLHNDAGSYAAIQEIKLLLGLGFKVTFVPENLAYFSKFTHYLQRMGVEVIHAPFAYSVNEVIESRGKEFDAFYITRYNVAQNYIDTIRTHSTGKIIFNNADLHFLRELRSALKQGVDLKSPIQTRDEELDVMRKVDVILSYNEVEHAVILSHNLKEDNIFLCPWVVDQKPTPNPFSKRKNIAFLGNFHHPPNLEALEFLANEVMPRLAVEQPDIQLEVYGSNTNEKVEAFETENIKIKGFAPSLHELFNSTRVFIAPLQSGAGIKGKVLEAMAHGVPTILTPIAAEGTKLSNKISTLVAKTPEEWISSIGKLYYDDDLWQKIRENAMIIAEEEFSYEKGLEKMKEAFESVDIFV